MAPSQPSLTSSYGFARSLKLAVGKQLIAPFDIACALSEIIAEGNLGILDHLERMKHDPFFLVAGTGLGKTVVVPIHVWLRQCESATSNSPAPITWIVEPRVLIAADQARYMDSTVRRILRRSTNKRIPPIFGSITSNGVTNPMAPIRFVTTGVFTSKALSDDFDPDTDRVVIDEAHETIAQNPDVELAVAVARSRGIHIDYMSATVQTSTIPELLKVAPSDVIVATNKRYPIFAINSGQPMLLCLTEIVDDLLIQRNTNSKYLPPVGSAERSQIIEDIFMGEPRSHALLVALNSITGPRSDLAKVQALLEKTRPEFEGSPIDILVLSSKQTSNEQEMARFDSSRSAIERLNRPYIVLATSVIEMGVTIPALDFVVTMDSGFQNVTVGDRSMPEILPLPFNSLKQRLGRVGRKRAGVGIITREVGAPYTEYSAEKLNSDEIEYEPVKTPLATARLDSLAMFTLGQRWKTPTEIASGIRSLGLASEDRLLELDRLQDLVLERRALLALGVSDDNGLTPEGKAAQSWVGSGWLPYAVRLEQAWRRRADLAEVAFWMVSLALSDMELGKFAINSATIDEINALESPTAIERPFIDNLHSPLGRYDLIRAFYNTFGDTLTSPTAFKSLKAIALGAFIRDCSGMDLSDNHVLTALGTVAGVRERFAKNHRKDQRTRRLPSTLPALTSSTRKKLIHECRLLPGQTVLRIGPVPGGHPDSKAWIGVDNRAIATASSSVPALPGESLGRARFVGRVMLRREPDQNGFWLDVTDHWVCAL
ncbi:helicase-related protein [Tsukamurella tyrosinosolvens]|uniref:helicase-related protein n=1 Tax=Tsukamurella tyrosinosolvens TaxID=57704 RepID=UPI000DF67BD0|nr:helicase-related protein [Tsukamurella tyrosinosolvens]RDB47052.1 hypothetical protein DVB87_14850 [Tsukamurella tyrosinosolvens]